eukprot:TRINITY_DN12731_c0_g1_i1.p2 TRINITY_DN12731_c0_g1~~TRINITY_DN12731_c0_g1_i1.p2  ORF type:complete len:258 (+),score=85.29 TRINITY_DN12731_c0_g1_i1:66-776(+)
MDGMDEEDVMISYDTTQAAGDGMEASEEVAASSSNSADGVPSFPALTHEEMNRGQRASKRKLLVPQHRVAPLRKNWMEICDPIVNHMKLDIRYDVKKRSIYMRTNELTEHPNALQKCDDFIHAFLLGFEVADAVAMLRLDDIFVESFQIEDVKPLHGDHLSRAIGRISGKDGKVRFTIENVTRTRIVVADKSIHIMGSFNNIKVARDAICQLILGSPPGKVYARLQSLSSRINERF